MVRTAPRGGRVGGAQALRGKVVSVVSIARVLVIASSDEAAGPLSSGLDALGWRTLTAYSADAAIAALSDMNIEAVALDLSDPSLIEATAAVRQASGARRLAMVGFNAGDGAAGAAHGLDLCMGGTPHPAQLALRLEQLVRAAVTEEELLVRRATFAEHGASLADPDSDTAPIRVLAVGAADRRFLALSNALNDLGAVTVAALTPYTAFDYLHESAFDAVVLWGASDHTQALSIATGMKRNTRLYHIPSVLYLRRPEDLNLTEIYNRGISDVATVETSEAETAARIMTLARSYRRQQATRRALDQARGSGLMDKTTGLFTLPLFAAHLSSLTRSARERGRTLSVAVLKVSDSPEVANARRDGWLGRAMPQIGAMISRLVRSEDTAARLSEEVFALALPATREGAARLAAERIAAVIGCTAFDAGEDRPPFVVELVTGVAEIRPGESASELLERAAATLAAPTATAEA